MTVVEENTGRILQNWRIDKEVDMAKVITKAAEKPAAKAVPEKPSGLVKSVDIQHALRASLQFEQSDGSRTTSYSSLEVGVAIHIEVPEKFQQGDAYKAIVDNYADEVLQMVDERIKKDARRLGLVAITDQSNKDAAVIDPNAPTVLQIDEPQTKPEKIKS